MFDKVLQRLKLKIMMLLGRAIVAAIDDSRTTQLLQLKLLADEVATNVERFEDYGLSSYPLVDSQALAAFIGGNRHHGIVLCVHDRRYRPSYLSSGEVALYTYEDKAGEHRIHFKAGGIINTKCTTKDDDISGDQTEDIGGSLTTTVGSSSTEQVTGSKTITAPSIQINGPTIILGATIVLNGTTTIGGAGGSGKTLATQDILNIFNNHVHSGVIGGGDNSGAPTTTFSSSHFTTTKAN